jgi:hypothetical protein
MIINYNQEEQWRSKRLQNVKNKIESYCFDKEIFSITDHKGTLEIDWMTPNPHKLFINLIKEFWELENEHLVENYYKSKAI